MKRTMAAELAAAQEDTQRRRRPDAAEQPAHAAGAAMSLIEFARATMPATSAGTSTLNWRPGLPTPLARGPPGQLISS